MLPKAPALIEVGKTPSAPTRAGENASVIDSSGAKGEAPPTLLNIISRV